VPGIRQEDASQVDRSRCGINRPPKAFFYEPWNPARVIQVCVGENYRINLRRRYRSILPVSLSPLFLSLKQAAVNQDLKTDTSARVGTGVDEMLGASYYSRCTEKLYIGQATSTESSAPTPKKYMSKLPKLKTCVMVQCKSLRTVCGSFRDQCSSSEVLFGRFRYAKGIIV